MTEPDSSLSVFFQVGEDGVPNDDPVPVAEMDMPRILAAVAAEAGNFVGLVDTSDVTLQAMCDGPDEMEVEIPLPAEGGSLRTALPEVRFREVFLTAKPPLSRYAEILNLEFQPW